jgi:hypothetical protein
MNDVTPDSTVRFNLPGYLDRMESRLMTAMNGGFQEIKDTQSEYHKKLDKLELQVVDLKSFNSWLVRGSAGAGSVIAAVIVATYEKWKSLLGF